MTSYKHSALRATYLVPGLPQILQCKDRNPVYQQLHDALHKVGADIERHRIERIVYFSTGWISVLGQMIQAKKELNGLHVDENWYSYGELPFRFDIDRRFAEKLAEHFLDQGYSTRLVDYEGFPVDTGTIVANSIINYHNHPTVMIANNVYLDFEATRGFAGVVRQTIEDDGIPTAVVGIGGLSGRYFTKEIMESQDHFAVPEDDQWNRKILGLLEEGKHIEVERMIPQFAAQTKAEMGWKIFAFLNGLQDDGWNRPAQVFGYGPVYGTGAAVVKLQ